MGIIFNSFSAFQYSLQESIQTVTKSVYRIEAYNLVGTTTVTIIPEKMILESKIEDLNINCIADCLFIDGLESFINTVAYKMRLGEVIISFLQDLKSHLVATNREETDFGGFVCPYNIITRIQQILKNEEILAEVGKHKLDLASLNMSEEKSITVYTSPLFPQDLFGSKLSTKSDIRPLPDYIKWHDKSLQTGLGYDI